MQTKIDSWRRTIAVAAAVIFLVIVAIKGISSWRDDSTVREGSIAELLREHPDARISQDLFRAWERDEVWVVARDLPPLQDLSLEELTAQEAYGQYGRRATSNRQVVFVLNAQTLKESRTSQKETEELEEVLLLAYEYSLRAEPLDTAVE